MGQSITAINIPENAEAFASILLADGTELNADAIIVAVGLTPNTSLAQHANLHIDPANGGISVDNLCRTSDPHIYAAGDCTSQSRPGYPGTLRLESWQNANEQARVAASAMLDQDTAAPAYPWFWTDQFDCNVQMLGLPQPDLVYVTRGNADPDNPAPKFVMLGLRDGTPYHALAVNAAGDLRALRPLLERSLPIDSSRFADESITLREFAKATVAAAAPTVP
jgi:3-phenylpropionate/trans-cinnamate dioxygenase ferredoxin reductase subunit